MSLSTSNLTGREREVLAWITTGKRNREIAAVLAISEPTVENHLVRIFEKLGVRTRTEAAMRARDLGIVPPKR